MISEKKQILVYLFCIIVVLGLVGMIYFNGRETSCEDCMIEFKNIKFSGIDLEEPYIAFDICPIELYEELMVGHCMIRWDKNQGYYNG